MGAIEAPGRPSTASERLYGSLLRLYPAEFRARYREEMVVLFSDQLRDARAGARGGVLRTWFRSLADLASSALGEHLRKDRTMAQSLATFEPTRSMRFLGLLAVAGGVLLLWAFVSWNPFADVGINTFRLLLFWVGGMAVALAFHARLAAASPRLALPATGAVVVVGAWNVLWLVLAIGRESAFSGAFGIVGFLASFLGWLTASAYGAALLAARAATASLPTWIRRVTRAAAVVLLISGPVATFGMDYLGLVDSESYGELFGTLGALGVGGVGLGWLLLGGVLLLAGRAGSGAGSGPVRA